MAAHPAVLHTHRVCFCRCHAHGLGNRLAGIDDQDPAAWTRAAVDRRDAAGAAAACDRCRDLHCPALSGTPPELLARRTIAAPDAAAVQQPEPASFVWEPQAGSDGPEA